jgi:hypothetical protein
MANARSLLCLVCLACVILGACSSPREEAPAPTSGTRTTQSADVQPVKAPEAGPAIEAELEALMPRHACNRITGCSGVAGLMRHGAALVEPARRALSGKGTDGYWAIALIEALGQLDLTEGGAVISPLLADKRWEIQLAAARGLAYLGPKMGDAEVMALASTRRQEPLDNAASRVRAALVEHALIRSGRDPLAPGRKGSARESLLSHLPPAVPEATPHPQLDAFVRLIGEARLPEGLPLVRVALHSRNRLVTATALDVAGSLQDTGAIPYALSLLDDPNPTLRKEAIRALQRITGSRQLDQADQWREWGNTHEVAPIPLPPAPLAGPQVLQSP